MSELALDARVDAVALDAPLHDHLPVLRRAGLVVVLPGPAPLDLDLLRAARGVPDAADVAVGLHRRWEPWARAMTAAAPLGGPPRQLTVRGWPRGEADGAELVDLVGAWCGEVLAAAAGPSVPAEALPDGARVAWSLLTASGATVLVSHEGAPPAQPLLRLTLASARLDGGPDGVRWDGGDPIGLTRSEPAPVAVARAALAAVGGGDLASTSWPWPADLGDLVRAGRVLAALRESARTGAPVRLS